MRAFEWWGYLQKDKDRKKITRDRDREREKERKRKVKLLKRWLVGFPSISTLTVYLVINLVYTFMHYINMIWKSTVFNEPEFICLHTVKWLQVLL